MESELTAQQFIAQVEGQIFRLAPELSVKRAAIVNPSFVVALSGGCDSTSLLKAMSRVCQKNCWRLYAGHINHGMRGKESDGDEAFCRMLCAQLDIHLVTADIKPPAGRPSEDELRKARYEWLVAITRELGGSYLVLGHTLDDQSETMLFCLFRGTGPKGLKGMPESRQMHDEMSAATAVQAPSQTPGSIVLLRPLLGVCRAQCRRFLQEQGQTWVDDSSNDSDDYMRNYIRHRIMPNIEQRFPHFQENAARLRRIIAEDEDLLESVTAQGLVEVRLSLAPQEEQKLGLYRSNGDFEVWSRHKFAAQKTALRKRLIANRLQHFGAEVSSDRIERIDALAAACGAEAQDMNPAAELRGIECGAMSLTAKLRLRVHPNYVVWEEHSPSVRPIMKVPTEQVADTASTTSTVNTTSTVRASIITQAQPVGCPGVTPFPAQNKILSIRVLDKGEKEGTSIAAAFPTSNAFEALVDFSNAAFPLTIRRRCPGDVIQPLGMNQRVRLKKFIHTRKLSLSPYQRANLAVLADKEEILWVPGIGISEKIRVKNGQPTHRLYWSDLATDEASIC